METVNDKAQKERYLREFRIASCFRSEPPMLLLHYSPGELLTSPFSPSQYLQFIVEGSLILYKMEEERSSVVLPTTFHEVSLIGEMELLDVNFEPFFVEAFTNVYTLAFHMEQYREQLLNDPVFLLFLCRTLSTKLGGATRSTGGVPLKERVEASLRKAEPDQRFSNIEGIAARIGVSKRQLLRVLKALCEEGVLEHEKKGVYRILKRPGPSSARAKEKH